MTFLVSCPATADLSAFFLIRNVQTIVVLFTALGRYVYKLFSIPSIALRMIERFVFAFTNRL
jgi:hypothetical protein